MEAIMTTLVLASASPRRSALLSAMGCKFVVQHSEIDESRMEHELVVDYVSRLATEKAQAIQNNGNTKFDKVAILAADTIVCQNETIFAKPKNKNDAFRIWQQLSNKQHSVLTAVSLLVSDEITTRTVLTHVEFGLIEEKQMNQYWLSGEPADKAGAYAIQGLASAWVKLIHGSYSNVVGLPLYETNVLLKQIQANWL